MTGGVVPLAPRTVPQKFAAAKMKETKELRDRQTRLQATSSSGNLALRDEMMALARQLEDFRANHAAAEARQHAMRTFMRHQNMLQKYQEFSREDNTEPELFDCGCGEDPVGNLLEYHANAKTEVQTVPVRFLDDPVVQAEITTERVAAVKAALEAQAATHKENLAKAQRTAACHQTCKRCGLACGAEPPQDEEDDENKGEEESELVALTSGACHNQHGTAARGLGHL